jgi:hypothetical protein
VNGGSPDQSVTICTSSFFEGSKTSRNPNMPAANTEPTADCSKRWMGRSGASPSSSSSSSS